MDKQTLIFADRWFQLYDINTFIHEDKLYIQFGNCEIEVSQDDIRYRALLYVDINK